MNEIIKIIIGILLYGGVIFLIIGFNLWLYSFYSKYEKFWIKWKERKEKRSKK